MPISIKGFGILKVLTERTHTEKVSITEYTQVMIHTQ